MYIDETFDYFIKNCKAKLKMLSILAEDIFSRKYCLERVINFQGIHSSLKILGIEVVLEYDVLEYDRKMVVG